MFASTSLNLLVPTAVTVGPYAAIVVRFLQGAMEGVAIPSINGVLRNWAPPLERSRLTSLAFFGLFAGPTLSLPVSGWLAVHAGWSAPYYLYGALGTAWYIVWLWLAFEKPSTHPSISDEEKLFLERSIGDNRVKIKSIPWIKMVTSLPVGAITLANFARVWTHTIFVVLLPKYFNQVFAIQLDSGSNLSTLPHLISVIVLPLGGWLADLLLEKNVLSVTGVRKLFTCGGFGGEVVLLLVLGFTKDHLAATIGKWSFC